jgi:transcriptional regulator with XRE-family HTH domain
VRRYRLAAKLSQEALAARMEVEQGYISRLEAGTRNPTIVTLQELADALGVQPAQLLEVPPAKGASTRRR